MTTEKTTVFECTPEFCRRPGPGKFEGEGPTTVMLWETMLNGFTDETVSDEHGGTCYDFFRSPLNLDADGDTVRAARAQGFCLGCVGLALQEQREAAGAVLWTDSQGFVGSRLFGSAEEYDKAVQVAYDETDPDPADTAVDGLGEADLPEEWRE